jgi:hypothetical protein
MNTKRTDYRCNSCKLHSAYVPWGPCLNDRIWNKISKHEDEILCWSCEEARARQRLGRGLRFSDLKPCPANFEGYGMD